MSLKFYLFLLLVISVTSHGADDDRRLDGGAVKSRTKRGAFWDFFQKIIVTGNLAYDQYNDTKTSLNEIYDLVSDGFSDKPSKRPRTTASTTAVPTSDDGNGTTQLPTTTTEKYRITRYELGRIAGRNFRGLKRLLNIELNDALNQSHYNIQEYQREAKMVFANSVVADKKAALKGISNNSTMTNATNSTNSTNSTSSSA